MKRLVLLALLSCHQVHDGPEAGPPVIDAQHMLGGALDAGVVHHRHHFHRHLAPLPRRPKA
jgi:hypothetical protein